MTPPVPSALTGLTAGFGMGPGGPPPLQPPTTRLLTLVVVPLTQPHLTRVLPYGVGGGKVRIVMSELHHRSHRHVLVVRSKWLTSKPPFPRTTPITLSAMLVRLVKPSTFSSGWLHTLLRFHLRPIQLVVSQRSYSVLQHRRLILRSVSHLDAFSGSLLRS